MRINMDIMSIRAFPLLIDFPQCGCPASLIYSVAILLASLLLSDGYVFGIRMSSLHLKISYFLFQKLRRNNSFP